MKKKNIETIVRSLSPTELKIYDQAKIQFENGQTYKTSPYALKMSLRHDYALKMVNDYNHYKKYPKGHYFRAEYDEMLKKYEV